LSGTSAVIASACVFNNFIDRKIDKKMSRTSNRALVTGIISSKFAIIYGLCLGLVGFIVLALFTNQLTLVIGLFAFILYVIIYGFFKRRTSYGTLIGSFAGATPPVAGYCAVSSHFDSAAIILFFIMVFWQMAHFYAISIFRFDDYKNASIPVLPVKKNIKVTKIQIVLYIVAFSFSVVLLSIYKYTKYIYLVSSIILSLYWLYASLVGFNSPDNKVWARNVFKNSLIVLLALSLMISLGSVLA
jgi:protoheme IX farnesyltransferase